MPFTRRAFVRTLGIGGASLLAARREAWAGLGEGPGAAAAPRPLLLHNNENPLGPGQAALDALRAVMGAGAPAGRYVFGRVDELHAAIAERFGARPENVVTGCGSTQILRAAVQMLTSPTRPLVAGELTYEECAGYAELIGTPVRAIPLDAALKLDLNAMADAAKGAGVVFLNNPNNPTANLHSGDAVGAFVDRVLTASPDTTVLIDEAYHDYVTDPSYRSQVPAALKNPRVIVARTFSKAHGMAGMRVGYALGHPDTIAKLEAWESANALNVAGIVVAIASIRDQARLEAERDRNTRARQFTLDWLAKAGFTATASQTNFVFANIKRPCKDFRDACRAQGVIVARDFPPFEKSHVRISIGTLEEMKQAADVFGKILGVKAKAA
ncbi:MAG TPA: aminotransferase class I/II-fold pyridoxal phosphate-dependent enzyme [Vicinamibacteria bacterium]|nr:aminotransferase class I/II-fold pyridoxal phosphate-dependent enzyme [Vicinamibacteria bacterium]